MRNTQTHYHLIQRNSYPQLSLALFVVHAIIKKQERNKPSCLIYNYMKIYTIKFSDKKKKDQLIEAKNIIDAKISAKVLFGCGFGVILK